MLRTAPTLLLLTAALAYAVLTTGAVNRTDWNLCLIAIGAAFISQRLLFLSRARQQAVSGPFQHPAQPDRSTWIALALPAYVALQLIPLPAPILSLLSPHRADLLASL